MTLGWSDRCAGDDGEEVLLVIVSGSKYMLFLRPVGSSIGGGREGSSGMNFSSCCSMISALKSPGRSTFAFSKYFISLMATFFGPVTLYEGGSVVLKWVIHFLVSSQADNMGKRNWNGKVFTPFCKPKPFEEVGISGGGNKVSDRFKSYCRRPRQLVSGMGRLIARRPGRASKMYLMGVLNVFGATFWVDGRSNYAAKEFSYEHQLSRMLGDVRSEEVKLTRKLECYP